MVRNLSRKLGKFFFQFLEMGPYWIYGIDVCVHSNSHWSPLRILRRFRMHPQSVLYIFQPRPLPRHYHHERPSCCARAQPALWSGTIVHGRSLLHLPHRICFEQPCTRDKTVQSLEGRQEDAESRSCSGCDLHFPGYRIFDNPCCHPEPSTCWKGQKRSYPFARGRCTAFRTWYCQYSTRAD